MCTRLKASHRTLEARFFLTGYTATPPNLTSMAALSFESNPHRNTRASLPVEMGGAWRRRLFGSQGASSNRAVETDAQGRPRTACASMLGRR
jgi:hypothetical protein